MQAPAALLAGKYEFKSGLQAGSKALAWLAEETGTGRQVIVSALAGARVAALKKSVNVTHPNLAALSDIIENPPPEQVPGGKTVAAVVVAGHHRGETLHQRLKRGPLEPALAVDWFVRIGGAIEAIHAAGGAHGAISPRSIIVGPEGESPGPILTQLVAPSSGAYCAPERLQGLGPSEADDVWALHAALFTSLTCTPPFRGENKNELLLSIAGGRMQRLEALGVNDTVLSEAVDKGLTADLKRRRAKTADFLAALEAWSPPGHSDWEEDEATLVASAQDLSSLAAAVGTGQKPQPVASVPPVALEDDEGPAASDAPPAPADAPGSDAPGANLGGYEDDDDATAIMSKPPAGLGALLMGSTPAAAEAAAPLPTPAAPSADELATIPENSRPGVVIPADTAATAPAPPPDAAETTVPAPPFAEAAAASSTAPAPAAFPPNISAYPPTTSLAPNLSQPALPQSSGDDEEIKMRSAARGPVIVIVIVLVLVAIGIGIAMYLNNSASRAGKLRSDAPAVPSRKPSIDAPVAPSLTRTATPSASMSAKKPMPKPIPVPAAPVDRGACVAGHFEAGTLSGKEDFEFLCQSADFRGINSQLHRRLVVAGAGKVTPGMREWSTFAWFELAATAFIRNACCPMGTSAAEMPETADGCPQLGAVLQRLSKLPLDAGEVEPRAKAFEDAVVCLFAKGIPRPYNYSTRPTGHARTQFQTFLSRAARS